MFAYYIESLSRKLSETLGTQFILFLLIIAPLFIKAFRRYLVSRIKRVFTRCGPLYPENIEVHYRIHESVILLREKLDASRVSVYQFHNGQEFSLSNPFWKITNTYESVKPGVSLEASRVDSLMVSLMLDFVNPFYARPGNNNGVIELTELTRALSGTSMSTGRRLFHYDYSRFRVGVPSQLMMETGVSHSIVTNLITPGGRTFGIVCAHYSRMFDESKREKYILELAKCADTVQYHLTTKKPRKEGDWRKLWNLLGNE